HRAYTKVCGSITHHAHNQCPNRSVTAIPTTDKMLYQTIAEVETANENGPVNRPNRWARATHQLERRLSKPKNPATGMAKTNTPIIPKIGTQTSDNSPSSPP